MFSSEFSEISKNTFFTVHLWATASVSTSLKQTTIKLIEKKDHDKRLIWNCCLTSLLNPSSVDPTKWSNTIKQFVGFCRQIVGVCLAILWGWRLKS